MKGLSLVVIIAKALGHRLPLTSEVLVHFGGLSHVGLTRPILGHTSLMLVLVIILFVYYRLFFV